MRRILFLISFLLFPMFSGITVYCGELNASARIITLSNPDYFPSFNFTDQNEEYKDIEDFNGKPTLVIFWATWCPYCKQFLRDVNQLQTQYSDQLNILPISCDSSLTQEDISEFYALEKIKNLDIYIDKNLTYKKSLHFTLPSAFLLDKDGKVVVKFIGSGVDWNSEQVQEIMANYL